MKSRLPPLNQPIIIKCGPTDALGMYSVEYVEWLKDENAKLQQMMIRLAESRSTPAVMPVLDPNGVAQKILDYLDNNRPTKGELREMIRNALEGLR